MLFPSSVMIRSIVRSTSYSQLWTVLLPPGKKSEACGKRSQTRPAHACLVVQADVLLEVCGEVRHAGTAPEHSVMTGAERLESEIRFGTRKGALGNVPSGTGFSQQCSAKTGRGLVMGV